MTLAGGNPDSLTLRQFIDAAAAVIVDEYRRLGIDLLTALEKVAVLGTDGTSADGETAMPDRVDNENAMQQLMARMGGVKGSPV